jgi:hypothetical protein
MESFDNQYRTKLSTKELLLETLCYIAHPHTDLWLVLINPLKPNDPHICRTAPLTSRRYILYIYSTDIRTEYFKHAAHSPFFLFNMPFISFMLPLLISMLFAYYIQNVLKLKCKIPAPKGQLFLIPIYTLRQDKNSSKYTDSFVNECL